MAGPEYFTDDAGESRFRIRARNGEIVHTSEGYTRPEDAERGYGDFARAVIAPALPRLIATRSDLGSGDEVLRDAILRLELDPEFHAIVTTVAGIARTSTMLTPGIAAAALMLYLLEQAGRSR